MEKKITDFQISMRGQLMVNLPVTIIIVVTSIFLSDMLNDSRGTIFVGCVFGWVYWKIMTPKWVQWATNRGVDIERLYRIGKSGLLVWNRQYIVDIVDKKKKPWF
ncbi:hypothetical protein ABGT15_14280 [Flavobacterium enshiense]|uniref:hypothetical protein n=1 Tax=Flavobacterium enshiense TaxID=1341165 RepID=UPI00345D07FF